MAPPSSASASHPPDGADLFLSLPDYTLSLIATQLSHPSHLLSLSLSSPRLLSVFLPHFLPLSLSLPSSPPLSHLLSWQSLSSLSHLSIFRFLFTSSKLLSLWAHQNPELGNLVYPLYGFLSLVFVRVIPQEVSSRLMYAPVLEIHCESDGSPSLLFLHGEGDSIHVGSVFPIVPTDANVLLLEADSGDKDPDTRSTISNEFASFGKLAFGDRRRLLDFLSSKSVITLPAELANTPIFPESESDFKILAERRLALISMHREITGGRIDRAVIQSSSPTLDSTKSLNGDRSKRSLSLLFQNGFKQIIGKSGSSNPNSNGESKHLQLQDFLSLGGDSIGLCLRAIHMRLTTYRSWPHMHDNRFALYKLPIQVPTPEREYAGLWGGAFGWPPARLGEDEQGKALFFFLLSYEETEGQVLLVATKILEGTHYVLHPNGSSMFIARMNEISTERFPWETDIKCGFAGEGIASGYGFRYPGSKPGSLFVLQGGVLAFVWRESKAVLTLTRVDLEEMLKKGERVPALPAIANFAYLTKSYSNVFTGFQSNSSCSDSLR